MTHQIHPLVDQLLLEQGDYCPLEILLQEGRLSYADYEAWRNGELDFLDEAPFGDPDHIQQDLLQWKAVRRAVEQEPRWHTDAVLLLRHAQACDQLHQQAAALASWFELCWRFPAQGDALASIGNHELRRQWTAYLDLDPELPVQSFPAWLLLGKPGLTRILPDPDNHSRDARGTEVGVTACPASYRTLFRLQQHGRSGKQTTPWPCAPGSSSRIPCCFNTSSLTHGEPGRAGSSPACCAPSTEPGKHWARSLEKHTSGNASP